jgi:hypothetical protein
MPEATANGIDTPHVLSPPMIAKRWGCKPESVIRLLQAGALCGFTVSPPGTKRPRWRVSLDALLKYEAGDTTSAPARSGSRRRRLMELPTGPF